MPAMKPFRAWRYSGTDLLTVTAPPYDVLSDSDAAHYRELSPHNIIHVDLPAPIPSGYAQAGATLHAWMGDGTLIRDVTPTLTLYRLNFTDATGAARSILGALGAIPVTDYGKGTVLPHENVTAKASTDRLDLTRATQTNLSPVWGLSLACGLADVLQVAWDDAVAAGAVPDGLTEAGVTHEVLPIADTSTVEAIGAVMASADVLIADGHHRYGVAQRYRDEVRAARAYGTPSASTAAPTDSPAEWTLMFVSELAPKQLCIEAIHRVYDGVPFEVLRDALATGFELSHAPEPSPALLAEMTAFGRLVLLAPDGSATWMTPRPGTFDDLRALDGLWLEHCLADVDGLTVTYEHNLDDVLAGLPRHSGAVLIRPTSIDEIHRTATQGLLMPPKSTFFTPKLRTGLVLRTLDE